MPRGTRKNSKKQAEKNGSEDLPLLQLANQADERLDIPAMEQWLWDAACFLLFFLVPRGTILNSCDRFYLMKENPYFPSFSANC